MPDIPIDQIINATFPLVTAAVGYIGGQFIPGFSKEFFAERARKKRHKIEVARKVLNICTEAKTGDFLLVPSSMEEVNRTLANVEGVDEKMGVAMTNMVNSWITLARLDANGGLSDEARRFERELLKNPTQLNRSAMLNYAKEENRVLVIWANKIRAGN
jgi:hypothetical protein